MQIQGLGCENRGLSLVGIRLAGDEVGPCRPVRSRGILYDLWEEKLCLSAETGNGGHDPLLARLGEHKKT